LAGAEQARPGVLEKITAEAVAVVPASTRDGLGVRLSNGVHLDATTVVLALGHFSPRPPSSVVDGLRGYINNPWDFEAIDRIDPLKPIAILGMGHTAIDALFHLTSCNPGRKVVLLSRRGLLPHGHRINPQPPALPDHLDYLAGVSSTVLAYARAVRKEISRRESGGGDWRDVINELRPHTVRLWEGLAETERRRFLARIVPFWDIHRHRLAPVAARRLKNLIDSGQASKLAGHIVAMHESNDGLLIRFRERHQGQLVRLEVGAAINCTGPCYDLSLVTKPLVVQLLADGMIRQDTLRLGLRVEDNHQVIGQNDRPTTGLFYVGPMLKARYWEAIAVPELRKHARQLASYLISL